MRIALGFWGITRSLTYTNDSINEKILNVFKMNNIQYDIFMHTFTINLPYNNNRAGEHNLRLNNKEYELLNPNFIVIENQENVKNKIDIFKYRTFPDPWDTNYETFDNFICAAYSKNKLTDIIKKSNINFDYIIFLRPDVKYLNDFSLSFLDMVDDNTICIPNFHCFSDFNDRFCITNAKTFEIYGRLFDKLFEYSKKMKLHSETVNALNIKHNNIKIIKIPFYFNRVRANGIEQKDANNDLENFNLKSKKNNNQ